MSPLLVGILVIAASALADVKHVLEGSAHPPDPHSVPPEAVNYLASPQSYWWMDPDSPLKAAYDHYKKCSLKGNCSPASPPAPAPSAPAPFRPQPSVNIDIQKNPFFNGQFQVGGAAFNPPSVAIDVSKNPFLNGGVLTTGNGTPVVKGEGGFIGVQPAQPFAKKPGFATTHPLEKKGFPTKHPLEGGQCKGAGFVCVERGLCVDGIVNKNGEGLLQVRSDVHYCNDNQVCCQLRSLSDITAGKSSVPDSPIKLAGSPGFSPIVIRPYVKPDIFSAGEHGHHTGSSTPKSIRDTSLSPNSFSTIDYSDTKFDDDVRFGSTFQGPGYLPPIAPTTPKPPPRPFNTPPPTIPIRILTPSVNQEFVSRPSTPKYVPPSPTTPRPTPTTTFRPPAPSTTFRPAPSTSREYLPPRQPSTPRPSTQPSSVRPYQPPTTQRPYQPPVTTQRPYQPPVTTQRPYQPPVTTQRPYQPPSTPQRPYQPPSTPQRPYQPPVTTPRPYQPPVSTPSRYQPPSTTQRPYQPPVTTSRPYQPPSTPQRPYQPPSTPQRPYQPPSTQRPYQPTSPRPTAQPTYPSGGYAYPKPTPTFGYPTKQPDFSGSDINNQYVKRPTTGYLPPSSTPKPVPNVDQNFDSSDVQSASAVRPLPARPSQPQPQPSFTGELNTAPPPGCAAALKCVQEIYCTAEGVISPVPVVLTKQQEENRVPTTVCQDTESGIIGKCCRDPNYKDPWPSANLVDGFDDGQYKEDDSIGQYKDDQGVGQYQPDLQRLVRSQKGGPRQDLAVRNSNEITQPKCGERHQGTNPKGPGPLDVNFAEIPWQAMILRDSNRSLLCGGVIISNNAVLTAAHCVEGLETSDILIKGGEWKLGIDEEPLPFQIVKVAVVVRHPQYQPGSLINDLALLVLEEKLRPSKNVGILCLPPPNQIPTENCIATGWGKRILQLHAKGAIMHSIDVKVMDNSQCQETLANRFQHALSNYSPNTLCGYSNKDQCRVDYGSALACFNGNSYVLSGIYAWDTGCKQEGQIGGYVAPDVEWIESTLAQPIRELKKFERN